MRAYEIIVAGCLDALLASGQVPLEDEDCLFGPLGHHINMAFPGQFTINGDTYALCFGCLFEHLTVVLV